MFKDQPVFCNRLKILTTEGLPESHFYLQFPSSGLSAIKNLKEPQKRVVSAYTNNGVKLQCLGQTLALFPHHSKVIEIACGWLQCWEVTQPRAFRDVHHWAEEVPHTTHARQLHQHVWYLCLLPTKPLKHKRTPQAAQRTLSVCPQHVCDATQGNVWFGFFFPKVPLSDLLPDLPAALYPPWQSLLNPLIC